MRQTAPNNTFHNIPSKSGFGRVKKHHDTPTPVITPTKANNNCNNSLLTVFQAAPLVHFLDDDDDEKNAVHPVSVLDFESEQKQLTESLSNGLLKIDVVFDIATTERLGSFLARGEGRVLHFSCHGHPDYLAIENGWGAMHQLSVEDLKEWISAGEDNLLFVFVSACHSRSAGEAFLKAGVKHVVCCEQDDQPLRNLVAVHFARAFYEALANGKRLGDAFELARQFVRNCSQLDTEVRQSEVEKLALLPEGVDHNIYIFEPSTNQRRDSSCQPCTTSTTEDSVVDNTNLILPVPPHIFEGRQVDVYHVLDALKLARLVRVTGSEAGIGKCGVVQAVCRYIQKRRLTFLLEFSEILWLPYQHQPGRDKLSNILANVSTLFRSNQAATFKHEYQQKFMRYLHQDDRKVLVVDVRQASFPDYSKQILSFIDEIVRTTRARVIMIHNSKNDNNSNLMIQLPCIERDIIIQSLDFTSTVHLFGKLCQHVAKRHDAKVSNHLELSSLLILDGTNASDPHTSYRGRNIFKMIGEGIPAKIHHAAKTMACEDYDRLIALGRRKEHFFNFESRVELEKESSMLALEVIKAAGEKRFLDAQEFQDRFDEMEILRESLPDYDILISLADTIQTDQQRAVKQKNFLAAHKLQEEYDALQKKIKIEQDAMERLGMKEEDLKPPATNDNEETRVELEAHIAALEKELQNVCEKNDIPSARKIDSRIEELKSRRVDLPSKEELWIEQRELNSCLTQAKDARNWDLADDLVGKLQDISVRYDKELQKSLCFEKTSEKASCRTSNTNIDTPGAFAIPGPTCVTPASTTDGNNGERDFIREEDIVNETNTEISEIATAEEEKLPMARPVASFPSYTIPSRLSEFINPGRGNNYLDPIQEIKYEPAPLSTMGISNNNNHNSNMKYTSDAIESTNKIESKREDGVEASINRANKEVYENVGEYDTVGEAVLFTERNDRIPSRSQRRANYNQIPMFVEEQSTNNVEATLPTAAELCDTFDSTPLMRNTFKNASTMIRSPVGNNNNNNGVFQREIRPHNTNNTRHTPFNVIDNVTASPRRREAMVPHEAIMNSEIIVPPIQAELLSGDEGVCMQQTDRIFLEQMIQESISNMIVPAVKVEKIAEEKPRRTKKSIKTLFGLKKSKS